MMNILRAQMDKVTAMLKHMGNVSRVGTPKKEPKRNVEDKHCNKLRMPLMGLLVDWIPVERTSELKDISVESGKTSAKRTKTEKKKTRTEYPGT